MAMVEPRRQEAPLLPGREAAPWWPRAAGTLRYSALVAIALLLLGLSAMRVIGIVEGMLVEGDDFSPYWNGATAVAAGQKPYAWIHEGRVQHTRDYIYPPPLAVLLAPLTGVMDYPTARWAWLAFCSLAVLASIVWVWRASGARARGPHALALAALVGLLPSLVSALSSGTLSPVLLLCMAGAFAALAVKREGVAGVLVATAGYLKSFPALLGGYLLLRRQWRACVATVGGGLLMVAGTLMVLGWQAHWDYFAGVVPAQRFWFGAASNVSITGVFTRLLTENPFTTPVGGLHALGPLAIALTTGVLLLATAYAVWRVRADRHGEAAAFGLVVLASLLASPINGNGNLIIAVIPLLVAIAGVQAAWPRNLRWLLLAALLLGLPVEFADLEIVRQYYGGLDLLVKELPWRQGWGNLLIDGPFFGLVALWALLFKTCLELRRR